MRGKLACFWSEPAPFADESLRRYMHSPKKPCNGSPSGHDASVGLGEVPHPLSPDGYEYGWGKDDLDHADPRWPVKCELCDYVFQPEDEWQHNLERKYVRADTGERFTLRKPLPGAMFDAHWLRELWHGADGRCLTVILPNGNTWHVDSRASNCTKPDENTHHCWVRHGEPPLVTVDKNGNTCNAGGGSILAGSYHGFLVNGILEEC